MKQHYVPQFLLRAWVADASDGRIEVFRLDLNKIHSTRHAPKGVGFEKDLFSLTRERIGGMEQHAVEKVFFREVDQEAAQVHKKLLNSAFVDITEQDRIAWARFLMSLRIRQPAIVAKLRRDASETLRAQLASQPEQYTKLAGGADPPTLIEWTEASFPGLIENVGVSFLPTFTDNERIGTAILRMGWHLRTFPDSEHALLLGDDPCIFVGGIDDPNLVIALPISPGAAYFAVRGEEPLRRLRNRNSNQLIREINESTIKQARARVYATDNTPRRFIENRWIIRNRPSG